MTVFLHEIRSNKIALLIWSAVISFMLGVCVIIYPEMSSQMGNISEMMSQMGSFSDAFGMDQLNFGEFMGYFGIECGNVLGLGGAMFAAILGASMLSKEENGHTAEFLLTHPLSRARIMTEKLFAAFAQVCIMNVAVIAITTACILAINVDADAATLALMFLAYFILQIEIVAITFGLSAIMKKGALGAGLGLVFGLYFANILANLTEELEFLNFITPFGYAAAANIIPDKSLNLGYIAVGMGLAALGIAFAYFKYTKKDIS